MGFKPTQIPSVEDVQFILIPFRQLLAYAEAMHIPYSNYLEVGRNDNILTLLLVFKLLFIL